MLILALFFWKRRRNSNSEVNGRIHFKSLKASRPFVSSALTAVQDGEGGNYVTTFYQLQWPFIKRRITGG
jgi:hypothetical protein